MRGTDLSAVGISGACLAHCLALPLFASLSPLLSTFASSEIVHTIFVAIAIPISAAALGPGLLRGTVPPMLFATAVLALLLLIAGVAEWPNEDWETPLTVIGASLLAITHLLNWRARGRCAPRSAINDHRVPDG
jgi:hypothetical protein